MGIKSDVLSEKNAFFIAIWAGVSSPRPARNGNPENPIVSRENDCKLKIKSSSLKFSSSIAHLVQI